MRTGAQQMSADEIARVFTEEDSPRHSVMTLSEFLPKLFQALEEEDVQVCILRNYEGFPIYNNGHDIDCLIRASDLRLVVYALRSIHGIQIVGYSERSYVANLFLQGVSASPESRAIQVDFYFSLAWKGLTYLPTDIVLEQAIPRRAGSSTFLVPSPAHEAITSLLTSLIIGGSLKEKYFPQVQQTFAKERSEVIAALLPQFGATVATRLSDSVIDGDREKVLDCVRPLRTSLVLRNLFRRPLATASAVIRHYVSEVAIRYSPKTLETVHFLSVGSCDQAAIIETLMPILQCSAVTVEKHHFCPRLALCRYSSSRGVLADREAEARYRRFASMVGVVLWLVSEWSSQFKKCIALRIVESQSHDVRIGKEWRCYGIPKWFARLVRELLPAPDLLILLDHAVEAIQTGTHEALSAELVSQLEAGDFFVKFRNRYVVLDARRPAARVTEEAYSAIIDMLAQRTDRLLKNRF